MKHDAYEKIVVHDQGTSKMRHTDEKTMKRVAMISTMGMVKRGRP